MSEEEIDDDDPIFMPGERHEALSLWWISETSSWRRIGNDRSNRSRSVKRERKLAKRKVLNVSLAIVVRDQAEAGFVKAVREAYEGGASLRQISRATDGKLSHESVRRIVGRKEEEPIADLNRVQRREENVDLLIEDLMGWYKSEPVGERWMLLGCTIRTLVRFKGKAIE